jgi:hypothetical protein
VAANTAVEEALYLSNIARKVYLVHRRDKLRSEKILQDKLFARAQAGKVELIWNHTVDEVLGDDNGVSGMRIRSTETNATRDIALQGFFVAIGHTPNTSLFEGQLAMRNGYLTIRSGLEGNATATLGSRRFRRRRCRRPGLSPGHHLGRIRLHGGVGRGEVPRQRGLMQASVMQLRIHASLEEISPAAWDALHDRRNPFVSHAFLVGLERTGCLRPRWGWTPKHAALYQGDDLVARRTGLSQGQLAWRVRVRPRLGRGLCPSRARLLPEVAGRCALLAGAGAPSSGARCGRAQGAFPRHWQTHAARAATPRST